MTQEKKSPALSRRQVFAGAGTVGALAAVAAVLPGQREPEAPHAVATPEPTAREGYQLTEHVRRYYQSAKL